MTIGSVRCKFKKIESLIHFSCNARLMDASNRSLPLLNAYDQAVRMQVGRHRSVCTCTDVYDIWSLRFLESLDGERNFKSQTFFELKGAVEDNMGTSDDATKSQLTYAQAVKGLKKPIVKNSLLSRTKDKRFSTTGATTTRSVVRFSTPAPRPGAGE
jgi:hypothetical protein